MRTYVDLALTQVVNSLVSIAAASVLTEPEEVGDGDTSWDEKLEADLYDLLRSYGCEVDAAFLDPYSPAGLAAQALRSEAVNAVS